jgi:hypothetical protein
MRAALLVLTFALAAMPASAACPSLPDDATSNYVENRTALALCQQRELGTTTDRAATEARFNAEIGNLEIELQRQRINQQQMLATTWPEL